MAQCVKCEKVKDCDYLKHPSNEHLTQTSYHNCQDFQGWQAGYYIKAKVSRKS